MSRAADTLVVQPTSGSALLAFEAHGLQPDCIETATLRVQAPDVDIRVFAWVSLETGLPQLSDGESLGSFVVARGSPEAPSEVDGTSMRWDVTELLRWSRYTQSTAVFFVVALKPEFGYIEPQYEGWPGGDPVEFGAMEAGQGATLTVAESTGCTGQDLDVAVEGTEGAPGTNTTDPNDLMADCLLDRGLDVRRSGEVDGELNAGVDLTHIDQTDSDARRAVEECSAMADAVVRGD